MTRRLAFTVLVTTLLGCGSDTGSPGTPIDTPPPASVGHNLVYADDLEMVLLVSAGLGGVTSPSASTRTRVWGWTGIDWRLLDSLGPPIRNLAGVA